MNQRLRRYFQKVSDIASSAPRTSRGGMSRSCGTTHRGLPATIRMSASPSPHTPYGPLRSMLHRAIRQLHRHGGLGTGTNLRSSTTTAICSRTRQLRLVPRTRAGWCPTITLVLTSCAGAPAGSGSADACFNSSHITRLRSDDHDIYIEPLAVAESNSSLLIAGPPNYLHHPDGSVYKDSLFGVILTEHGRLVPIPKPISGNIVGQRAYSLATGGWRVLFSTSSVENQIPELADSTWIADIVDYAWRDVRPLDAPPPDIDRIFAGSAQLLGHGRTTTVIHAAASIRRGWGILIREVAGAEYREEFIVTPMFGYATATYGAPPEPEMLQVLVTRPGIARGRGQSHTSSPPRWS